MKKSIGILVLAAMSLAIVSIYVASALAVDVSKGQFYTEEEYQKLKKADRIAYCDALAKEADRQKQLLASDQSELDKTKGQVEDLKAQIKKVDGDLDPLKAQVSQLDGQIKDLEGLPTQWTVKSGECLSKISGYTEIYSDPKKWPRIYRANRDKIQDPNLIITGWVLAIPRGLPGTHTVVGGEWLSKISGYWEIYNDWRQWTRIYEANKDKIKDPNVIRPGWELTIPR
ncbi:MAG TPA: LysM peptidoglycan-binding domain-containing protein [bacterium]|nr:LysM peptidoglycan-binding domain-containing protein [bacterium]